MVQLDAITLEKPQDVNLILGQSHFIKTVEDLYEACMNVNPNMLVGIAFAEASADCLIRVEGNDAAMKALAADNLMRIRASHCFLITMRDAYPISVLNAIKAVPEVCTIFGASANPMQVIVAETEQGRGVMGVIDGLPPTGIEAATDVEARGRFLKNLGYKR